MLNELNHVIDYIEDHLSDDLSLAQFLNILTHKLFLSALVL